MNYNYFNYMPFRDKYLLTNDFGRYIFLSKDDLYHLLLGEIKDSMKCYEDLKNNYFIYDESNRIFAENAGSELRNYRRNLFAGTALHIFVLTKQCNQQCVYCQASANIERYQDMSAETAGKAVDIALQSPSDYLTFEFQGGEPLLNFPVLKKIVEYTDEKKGSKKVNYSLVSNLMNLDEEKIKFIKEHDISICTSLDGDESLHNQNRPFLGKNTFQILSKKLNVLRNYNCEVSAIQTTTRMSLKEYKSMIDQYIALGFQQIFIRPLTPLGYAKENWEKIGYSPLEFQDFYAKSLSYILELNRKGVNISEGHAKLFLNKIFNHDAGNYMELRSPCGGAIGQMAYYYDGNIYSCDEARMLAAMGDDRFRLGNVFENSYEELMNAPACRVLMNASCLEGLNDCCTCAYSPYCGTCPVISLARYGTVYPQRRGEYRCEIYKGMLNTIFDKLFFENSEIKETFISWL